VYNGKAVSHPQWFHITGSNPVLTAKNKLKKTEKGVKTFYIYINIIKTMKNLNNISTAIIGGGAGAKVTGWFMS
jgi:hypothetical protein